MAKKPDLLAKLRAYKEESNDSRKWINKQSEANRKILLQLRDEFKAGQFATDDGDEWSIAKLHRALKKSYGITGTEGSLRRFLLEG